MGKKRRARANPGKWFRKSSLARTILGTKTEDTPIVDIPTITTTGATTTFEDKTATTGDTTTVNKIKKTSTTKKKTPTTTKTKTTKTTKTKK